MVSGVEPFLLKFLIRSARHLQVRAFSSSLRRPNNGPHVYFRRDSPIIHYPEYSHTSPNSAQTSRSLASSARELTNGQSWSIFFGGFITFPILCLGYYWGDWAFGSKLWKSEIQDLEEKGAAGGSRSLLKHAHDSFMNTQNLYHVLQRANAETKALHDLILLWINPESGLHAVRDTQLLKKNPIQMSNGEQLDASKAILIRILDKEAKTVVLLLGVDLVGHNGTESDPNLAWCHDHAFRAWMDERAEELRQSGDVTEHGVSLYCYTPTSSGTSLPGKGAMWQEARLFPEDLPSGFPLSALEHVKTELHSEIPGS